MKKRRPFIIAAAVILGIGLLGYSGRLRQYTSEAAFTEAGGKLVHPIPAQAENCRFAYKNVLIGKHSVYDFTLSAEDAEAYEAELIAQYNLNSTDEKDLQYGYAHWYGKTAAACAETENALDAFPLHLPFSRVTERDIASAEVLVYAPYETGSRCFGILRFPDSGEFVGFYSLSR